MLKSTLAAALAFGMSAVTPATALDQAHPADTQPVESVLDKRASEVIDMLNGELEGSLSDMFTEQFLAAVNPAQLSALSNQITANYGRALSVEKLEPISTTQASIHIRMERAIAKGMVAVSPGSDGKIIGLRFTSFESVDDSIEKIVADLNALPGKVSAYFAPISSGDPILSIAADEQMAIGSTFKLYVLAALAQDIADGKRQWSDVVELNEKSFPSGQMQDWPKGAPVTLHTLASMMISISDNTATDQLIKVLGHDRIMRILLDSEHAHMELNNPFLTTRQLFLLKGGPSGRLDAYRNGTSVERADILADLETENVSTDDINAAFTNGPLALDVEWFASGTDLANLFKYMSTFGDDTTWDILSINKSITPGARKGWSYVGYKGGSEPGVLNMTWLLEDVSGKHYMLSLSWNDATATLDQTKLELIAQRILSLPR